MVMQMEYYLPRLTRSYNSSLNLCSLKEASSNQKLAYNRNRKGRFINKISMARKILTLRSHLLKPICTKC
ncbi:hypothetical protein Syun_014929 [Stephania yunnanensis]|uniref:Uncharacterized protein n=1 Tax=Stephania yunnanensis TaxID=152371 RepID=A0AAP0JKL0_9MAGN